MKQIGITQRVDVTEKKERRNSLDQRWIDLLMRCDLNPIILPNHLESLRLLIQNISFSGFVLSGGNDLHFYSGDAPERDEVELFLISYAIDRRLPLLGVCRGMQVIHHYFGDSLKQVEGHAGAHHAITSGHQVNSYHHLAVASTTLQVCEQSKDGVIESTRHPDYPILGVMWHPERENPFREEDIQLIQGFFRS